jgi:hypothetical protein
MVRILLGCGVWGYFEGEKGEREKIIFFPKPFHPTHFYGFLFLPSITIRL